jgi:hypothetical protein
MKTEKLIIFVIFLGLIQLAACEQSKIVDPALDSLRESSDSVGQYPGDTIPGDSVLLPDTLSGEIDSLPYVDTVSRQPIKAGEEFLITPSMLPDTAPYLRLDIVTKKHYNCLDSHIDLAATNNFGEINIKLNEIVGGGQCQAGTAPSKATIYFNRNNTAPDSTYQIQIKASGQQYNGSLKKSGANYVISWPYESGVIFTKKSI